MSDPTLADVMANLNELEEKIDALPTEETVRSMIATTADQNDASEIQKSLDALHRRLDDLERRHAVDEIRRGLRRIV